MTATLHPILFLGIVCMFFPAALLFLLVTYYGILFSFCWLMTILHIGEVQYPYAYKTLAWDHLEQTWTGPVAGGLWIGGRVIADLAPKVNNENGIYCCKNYWYWELHLWKMFGGRIHLVQMSNPVFEYKHGYRANGARLVD